MKRLTRTLAAIMVLGLTGLTGLTGPAAAGEQTQMFAVENMTCAACPITVKKAMQDVEGVNAVEIDFSAKTATVTFDGGVVTPDAIADASANAGYPAHPTTGG